VQTKALLRHIAFWLAVLLFYTFYFGAREDEYGQSLFFVSLLMPITMATTYTFLYWLIPQFLLEARYGLFALYFAYTIIVSVYLNLVILVGLYMTVADYQALFVSPNLVDLMGVLIGMYVVVFCAISFHFLRRWRDAQTLNTLLASSVDTVEQELARLQNTADFSITVRSDRKDIRVVVSSILYIESMRDYVQFNTSSGVILSKMALGKLEQILAPHGFTRIHRSYLVRDAAVDVLSGESVQISGQSLPIGRSYRKSTQAILSGRETSD